MKTTIHIQHASNSKVIPTDEKIKQYANIVLEKTKPDAEVTIRISEKDEIQALNKQYRQQDKATNVLAFPFENPPGMNFPVIGDVIICAPVVAEEALAQDKTFEAHFAHMVVHGILHCLGYDHITTKQAEEMEALEITLLKSLGFENPYGELSKQ